MNVTIVRPQELGDSELAAWRTMQRSRGEFDNAFLSPGFTLAAGRVRTDVLVAVLEEGHDVVGFFPFERTRLRVGRPVAAGVCDAQAVIHTPEFEWNGKDLLRACNVDVLEFDHLIASQMAYIENVVPRNSSIIDVSDGYESYIAERQRTSRKIITSTFAKQRKLERDRGETRFEFDVREPQALRILMQWKSTQYRRTGWRDRLAIQWVEGLVWDLFETSSDGCVGTLSALYAAERLIAAHFGLRCDSTLSCWFPAYDVNFAKYSPGLSLHLKMAEGAPRTGIQRLDLGKGDEVYKASLRSVTVPVGEGWIDRTSPAALVRRAQRTPPRLAVDLVMRHPTLRRSARRILRQVGSLRSRGVRR
jgi:CelD/BcsL family acetyltransferase involved in cellulose biosynthesis